MATFVLPHVLLIVVTVSISECATHVNPCVKHCELTSDWTNWDCSGCHNNVGTASRHRSFCCFLKTKQECLSNCSKVETDIFQQVSCINVCYIPTTRPSTVHATPSSTPIMPKTPSTGYQTPTNLSQSSTINPTGGGYIPTKMLSKSHATPPSTTIVHKTPSTRQQTLTKLSQSSTVNPTDGDYIRHGTEQTEATNIMCGGTLVSIGLFLLGLVIGAVAVAIIIHCCCYDNSKKDKTPRNSTKHPHNRIYGVRSQQTRNKDLIKSSNANIGFEHDSSRAKNIRQVSPVSSTANLINPWSDTVEHSPSGSPKYPSPILGPNNPLSLGRHQGSCVFEELPYNNSSNNSRSSSIINNNSSSNNNKNYNNSRHTRVTI